MEAKPKSRFLIKCSGQLPIYAVHHFIFWRRPLEP